MSWCLYGQKTIWSLFSLPFCGLWPSILGLEGSPLSCLAGPQVLGTLPYILRMADTALHTDGN